MSLLTVSPALFFLPLSPGGQLRALVPIAEGTELTVNYKGASFRPTSRRRLQIEREVAPVQPFVVVGAADTATHTHTHTPFFFFSPFTPSLYRLLFYKTLRTFLLVSAIGALPRTTRAAFGVRVARPMLAPASMIQRTPPARSSSYQPMTPRAPVWPAASSPTRPGWTRVSPARRRWMPSVDRRRQTQPVQARRTQPPLRLSGRSWQQTCAARSMTLAGRTEMASRVASGMAGSRPLAKIKPTWRRQRHHDPRPRRRCLTRLRAGPWTMTRLVFARRRV